MEILNNFNTSVEKALSEIDSKWRRYDGLIICGTHSPSNTEFMIDRIAEARKSGRPFLGICAGYQLTAIEFARHVLSIKDATSEEFGEGTFVVKKLPELNVGLKNGESYWNWYEVDSSVVLQLEQDTPENFFITQSHPEYQSSKEKPHPLLVNFLNYAKSKMAM